MGTDGMGSFKLGIGLPLTDEKVYSQFLDSWVQMEIPPGIWHYGRPQFRGPIDQVRNYLVRDALDAGCTHLIMLDTDQIYPPDTITRLLAHDKDIVGAKVYRKYPPYDPILVRGAIPIFSHVPDEECESGELVEVDATGCGCIMFRTALFTEIEPPWFKWEMPVMDGVSVMVGEDFYFCRKAKEADYRIYVDTSVEVSHMALMQVNQSAYKIYSKIAEAQKRIVADAAEQ